MAREAHGPGRVAVVCLLLALLGALVLWLGTGEDCLALGGAPGQPADRVCQRTVAPGAVVFAVVCWAAAAVVWWAGRRRRSHP